MYSTYKKLDKFILSSIYLLLIIPLILFVTFWFKWYISFICLIIICYLFYRVFSNLKYKTYEEYLNIFNFKKLILMILFLICLNVLSGSGGFMYQNWDYNARNAVLHDLIDYDWPVKYVYEKSDLIYNIIGENGRLSYYFAYWLPSALVGKIFDFSMANLFLFFYQTLLLIAAFYLISRLFGKSTNWYIFLFILFSGIDIIGVYILNPTYEFQLGTHIDIWGAPYAYSSFITQLFWVFNQSIPVWIVVLLFLNNRNFKNLGILLVLSLTFSPFPTVGFILLILYMILIGLSENKLIERVREAFTFDNLIAIVPFLMIALFYLNNTTSQAKGLTYLQTNNLKYMLFVMFCEFGLLSLLCINRKNWKYILANSFCLFICGQFYLGNGCDFVNRTSIPFLVMLLIYLIDILEKTNLSKIKLSIIVIYLSFSSITPISEITRTYNFYKENGFNSSLNINDNWKTYGITIHEDAMKTYIKNFSSPIKDNFFDIYIFK